MSAAVRWLALVVAGWVGVRAATIEAIPRSELFTVGRAQAATGAEPPSSRFPPLEPAVPLHAASWQVPPQQHQAMPPVQSMHPILIPYQVPVYRDRGPIHVNGAGPMSGHGFMPSLGLYSPIPSIEDWPLAPLPAALPAATPASKIPAQPPSFEKQKFDRLQLSTWALLRGREGIGQQPRSLANGGTLGASQAGARLLYRFSPEVAASLRTTSAVGTSQSEVAAGIRLTPIRSLPLSVTAERRQAIGRYGARSAFALFAEGGIYGQSLMGLNLDSYAQAGVVGLRERAFFADGAVAFTRPVYRQLSGGFGVWGGIQPGVYRIDAGPRLSYQVRRNVRVHIDWRQRLAGSALPGSGPAVTLAGDF